MNSGWCLVRSRKPGCLIDLPGKRQLRWFMFFLSCLHELKLNKPSPFFGWEGRSWLSIRFSEDKVETLCEGIEVIVRLKPLRVAGFSHAWPMKSSKFWWFLRFIGVRSTLQLGSVNPYIYWDFVRLTIKRILKEEGIITLGFFACQNPPASYWLVGGIQSVDAAPLATYSRRGVSTTLAADLNDTIVWEHSSAWVEMKDGIEMNWSWMRKACLLMRVITRKGNL